MAERNRSASYERHEVERRPLNYEELIELEAKHSCLIGRGGSYERREKKK
jgi:hypothetical protein